MERLNTYFSRQDSALTTALHGLPGHSVVKNLPAGAGDVGLIPESGRSPGEETGDPHQHSCLENSRDKVAWGATVHGAEKS